MIDAGRGADLALIDADASQRWTYDELRSAAREVAGALALPAKGLVFVFARNDLSSVAAYLGAVEAGHAAALLDAGAQAPLKSALVEAYRPDFVVEPGIGGRPAVRRRDAPARRVHPDLEILLATSGTTGSPKLARLSRRNVESNARAIGQYLGLDASERACASLPLHYSFGMSVLNSHLAAGACVVLTGEAMTRPAFWEKLSAHRCTSLAGVPYSFEIMRRVGYEKLLPPSVRTLLQAGGKMSEALVLEFDRFMKARDGRLFVMYGQTEASPRIAYVPPERLPQKAGSAGVAIPGGSLSVEDGEVVYRGPNVMLGYAESSADLLRGDELGGVLRTGDLGRLDADGFLYITGRRKRFSKVYGLRLALDDVEVRLRERGPAAVVGGDDRITGFCEFGDEPSLKALARELAALYGVNAAAFDLRRVDALPLKSNGKIDYDRLPKTHGPGRDPSPAPLQP